MASRHIACHAEESWELPTGTAGPLAERGPAAPGGEKRRDPAATRLSPPRIGPHAPESDALATCGAELRPEGRSSLPHWGGGGVGAGAQPASASVPLDLTRSRRRRHPAADRAQRSRQCFRGCLSHRSAVHAARRGRTELGGSTASPEEPAAAREESSGPPEKAGSPPPFLASASSHTPPPAPSSAVQGPGPARCPPPPPPRAWGSPPRAAGLAGAGSGGRGASRSLAGKVRSGGCAADNC